MATWGVLSRHTGAGEEIRDWESRKAPPTAVSGVGFASAQRVGTGQKWESGQARLVGPGMEEGGAAGGNGATVQDAAFHPPVPLPALGATC